MQSPIFSDFIAYFRTIAKEHVNIEYFVHGASERIISQSRSDLKYPCLWLETPSMRLSDTTSDVQGWRETGFVVFINSDTDDYEKQDHIWQKTEEIVLDIISRLRKDSRQLQFKIDLNSISIDPIHTIFVDNDYGWRVEFRTDKSVPICYHPEKWSNI